MQADEPREVEVGTYRDAIRSALSDELHRDSAVILMGEDVAEAGGVFKTSEGIHEEFGARRVFNTPISENGFLGVALGMAATGLRPVVEIMFSDFLPTAGDAVVNEVPKLRFMSGGQVDVPLTIRSIGGGTGGFGTQHSATGESWYAQIAGLRIATAGTPQSAYQLLRASIQHDNPVLFIEHKGLYTTKGPIDRAGPPAPVGQAKVLRNGSDVTIVASLLMVKRALEAAEELAHAGVSSEVIDIQWVRPFDTETIERSVRKTQRLLVVAEEEHAASWGASLISNLAMRSVSLTAPPQFLGLPADLPMPYSPPLETAAIPDPEQIAAAVSELVGG